MLGRSLLGMLIVVGSVGCGNTEDASGADRLAVSYTGLAGPGFIDQTVSLLPGGDNALAVSIEYEALNGTGDPIAGVEVTTAFGSDRGLLVVPPDGFIDVLTFSGENVPDVVDVGATVRSAEPVPGFGTPTIQDPQPLLDGAEVTKFDIFDQLRFTNDGSTSVALRVVCLIYDSPEPGRSQQAIDVAEVVSRIEVETEQGQLSSVSPGFEERSELLGYGCDSLKAHPTP